MNELNREKPNIYREEEFLQKVARAYAHDEGEALLRERNLLNEQNIRYLLPRADKRVKELTGARGRRTLGVVSGLVAAAAVALIFVLPGSPFSHIKGEESASAPAADSAAGTGEISNPLELSFKLPERYTLKSANEDNGVGVFYIERDDGEGVVMTMAGEDAETEAAADYPEKVEIDGVSVPAKITADYKLIMFVVNGKMYILSSKNDIGALAALYRAAANVEK